MGQSKVSPNLHNSSTAQNVEEVLVLADIVGKSEFTLIQVIEDFIKIISNPILAGGFAMAHHGYVRGTVDVDAIALTSIKRHIPAFTALGYKHESVQLPIAYLETLTKGNKGVDFIHLNDAAFAKSIEARATIGLLHKHQVRYVSLEDLIILKCLALNGRSKKQDEADLENLLPMNHDIEYVDKWKKKFGV